MNAGYFTRPLLHGSKNNLAKAKLRHSGLN